MNFAVKLLGATGVGFLCLHTKPREERYKTYWHKMEHDGTYPFGGYSGFGVRSGVPIKRGNESYNVNGYICAECGHIKADRILEKSSDLNDTILNRVDKDLWMSDEEWCNLMRNDRKN